MPGFTPSAGSAGTRHGEKKHDVLLQPSAWTFPELPGRDLNMARKRKYAKKRDPNQITAVAMPEEDGAVTFARTVLRPSVQAAVTIRQYGKAYGDLDLGGLVDALAAQAKAASDGDLGRGEAMLTTQAHILDAIFNNLARRAINAEYMNNFDRYLKLALRAQSQCRATWETLSTMKNPPMAGYVGQANIAHGHQQVNNTSLDCA